MKADATTRPAVAAKSAVLTPVVPTSIPSSASIKILLACAILVRPGETTLFFAPGENILHVCLIQTQDLVYSTIARDCIGLATRLRKGLPVNFPCQVINECPLNNRLSHSLDLIFRIGIQIVANALALLTITDTLDEEIPGASIITLKIIVVTLSSRPDNKVCA